MFFGDDSAPYDGGIFSVWRSPVKLGDVFHRTEIGRGIAVATEAEIHVERLHLPDFRHLVDAAVATDAAYARINVSGMVEVNIRGELMNVYPFDGLAGSVAVANFFEQRAVGADARVTVHANLSGRNRRERRLVDGVVAIVTIHTHIAGMQFVTIGHGLHRLVTGPEDGGPGEVRKSSNADDGEKNRYNAADSNILVNYFREESCHRRRYTSGFLLLSLMLLKYENLS